MSRNVIIACLDSVRKDFFDRYANEVPERAGLSLKQCRAASSWSTPSHASMLTGLLPSEHGVHTHDSNFRSDGDETFLASLPDHRSVGISANIFFSPRFGFDTPFDDFVSISTGRRFPRGLDVNEFVTGSDKESLSLYWDFLKTAVTHDHPLRSVANGVLAQVNVSSTNGPIPKLLDDGANIAVSEAERQVTADHPVVMFLNFGDAHVPLRHIRHYDRELHSADNEWTSDAVDIWDLVRDGPEAHREYLEKRRGMYGAAIEYLDRKMIELYERTDRASPHETTLIVTADHGENLGFEADDHLLNHKSSLTESLLHVPLYVVNPPPNAPGIVDEYTSHLDLGELVVALATDDWTDISRSCVPAEVIGMSPGPSPPDERKYWDRMIRCAYRGTEKYVWDSLGFAARYRLDPDRPCWQTRVDDDASAPSWATNMFDCDIEEYKRSVACDAEPATEDVDDQTRNRLEELGYL
jgi:arylsulfatase A-like enzyme